MTNSVKFSIAKAVLLAVALSFSACSSKEKTEASSKPLVEEKAAGTKVAKTAPNSSDSSFPAVTGTEKSSVTCSTKTDTRKISVLNESEGGCGVVYNKAGVDKTVAIAKANLGHCDTVAAKIKTNLEAAGYDCGGGTSAPAATEAAPQ